jgi:hypothetical protein
MKFLLLMLIPFNLFADAFDLTEEELNPTSEEILIQQPEKYLRNESMIYDLNTSLGIKDQRRYTGMDKNRFSVAGHLSGDYEHLNDILGFEATYMRKSSSYSKVWYGGQVFRHQTYFDAITQNSSKGKSLHSESKYVRPGNTKNTVMGLGLGLGYRFKFLFDVIEADNWFESVDVFGNVIDLEETFIGEKYRGYGLTANYGIHKRSSTSYFYGGKLSYNVASVTRDAIGKEEKDERSLSLGWLSVAFELGFFY